MTTTTRIRSLAASALVVAALTLAACTTGTAATSAPSLAPVVAPPAPVSLAPIDTPSPEPSASQAATSPEPSTAEVTAVPTSIDPCKIVTTEEVNKLTGANFSTGQGQEETDTNNVKRCTYGQEGVDFMVTAAVAPDVATAKKNEADTKADLEANAPGFPYKLTELPGFAPGADAALVEGSAKVGGGTYSGIAIYVLRGTTFFAITDIASLGAAAPSAAQMEDQAKVTLGRVP
jgi:hypothetical protein